MTVVASIPSQTYTPRTISAAPAVPTGTKTLRALITAPSAWPLGDLGSISVNFPDGSFCSSVAYTGDPATNRDGSPNLSRGLQINGTWTNGVMLDLPAGNYAVSIVIAQTLTAAVLIERF